MSFGDGDLHGRVEELERENDALRGELASIKGAGGGEKPDALPRCPLRMKALDHPDRCDAGCAWLVKVTDCGIDSMLVCAATLAGIDTPRKPMNRMKP